VNPKLIEALEQSVSENVHQYMPMAGHPGLVKEVCELIDNQYRRQITEKNVVITAGASQAIFTAIIALVGKGDEVIILDPCYDCYEPAVILAGGIPVRIPLDSSFKPDWTQIEQSTSSETRMIIVNNPHNPSGVTWEEHDIEALTEIVSQHSRLLVLSDEVYEFITFNEPHLSVHSYEGLKERAIVVSSFGKTFHITGWKIGYMIAEEAILNEVKKVHQYNVFCVNSVAQQALSKYMQVADVNSLGPFYKKKSDLFRNKLSESKFELLPCGGSYFQLAKYNEISEKNDVEFCEWLTKEVGVAAIPLSVFSEKPRDDNYVRFCFAKDDKTIINATELLCNL
jgi:methionine aminotransferase